MSEGKSRSGLSLEAAVAPAGVEIEAFRSHAVDDRRAIHRHVQEAAPVSQDARPSDRRHQRHPPFANIFHDGKVAALGIGVVAVYVSAEDKPALVRLADVEMPRAKGDDAWNDRLQPFRDEGLYDVAFDRQPHSSHGGDARTVAGHRNRNLLGSDQTARSLHAGDAAIIEGKAGDFAVLDDIDAAVARAARITPRHRVVPDSAAATLQ